MRSKAFVFAVCGAKEHIAALHFSITALKQFSNHSIIVVTDSSRNEIPILHNNLIDESTPSKYTNHQASIYLKTNLHHILPTNADYCYLDSDVVPISPEVDSVFNFLIEPIAFSLDYTTIDEFSPFAVNCNCMEKFQIVNSEYIRASELYEQTLKMEYLKVLEEITQATEQNRSSVLKQLSGWLKYYFSGDYYVLNDKYKLNIKSKQWLNNNNEVIEEKYSQNKFITAKTGFIWSEEGNDFLSKNKFSVTSLKCEHLRQQIKKTFNHEIIDKGWKHWNGGVFLFNETSHPFMDCWHEATLKIFENPEWKIRDQGTLAATAWEFGLQNQKPLDINFNFIVDYNNKELIYYGNFIFQSLGKIYKPFFLHIFHHFGDKNWAVWQDVEKLVSTAEKQNK